MKIAIIQSNLTWENPAANRKNFEDKMLSITEAVDIILLPEMFTTGFTMNPKKIAEQINGESVQWMESMAKKFNAAICGSLVIIDEGSFYNRLLFVMPSGEIKHYNKKHLFTLAGEDKIYQPGNEKVIIEYKGLRICPQICYDLRFPAFSRNLEDFDLLLYVANWPKPRINAWDVLLKARAIENMCFVIGVNRIGEDNNQHQYVGHSQAVNYLGEYLVEPIEDEGIFVATLDKERLLETRNKLGFLKDRDKFTVS